LSFQGRFAQALRSYPSATREQSADPTQIPDSAGVQFVNTAELNIVPIVSVPFEENSYIAYFEGRDVCLVVDPGLEPQLILDELDNRGLQPAAILNTHGHTDHIAGNGALKQRWPQCPLVIGKGDAPKLLDPQTNLSASFGIPIISPPADVTVCDGDTYSAAGINLMVLEIPGHSVGHVVYLTEERNPQVVFAGDVIFAGSIGRTDFPDGNFETLADGIRSKLYNLPDSTQLYTGHGPVTTVGAEKTGNPFVRGQ
jgi:glyoxylase-like metal-dependent hydrolase (beta-lactamase superfamily II)